MEEGWDVKQEDMAKEMSTIIEQADRMTHIIEHVRMFAREAGKAERAPVQVNEVVMSAVGLENQLRSHGITLDYELAENLPAVEANAFSLEEVILNLMNNSLDAMMDESGQQVSGSRLKLRTAMAEDAPLVIVEVQDSGSGIDPDVIEKVFDPFFTTKGPDKGTGLGLAVSRSLVEELGGRIEIHSQPDHGTTVTVSLPQMTTASIS
jgi:C4-dicarboxylate-specific signal transduction histidine kinase